MVILKDILRDLLYSRHSCRLKIKMYIMSCELNFIWVKIRNYSPGERISDSSEKLLQKVGEWSMLCMILVKGGRCSQAHLLAEAYC